MARTPESSLQAALSCWDTARRLTAMGQLVRAGLTYQKGLNNFLVCINLSRFPTARSRPFDLVPVFHGMGAMGLEGVPVMERARATDWARRHARTTLAASHLADPTEGVPERIEAALASEAGSAPRLDVSGDGLLTAEARIAGAGEARLLLATLLLDRPDLRRPVKRPWPIDYVDGRVFFTVERSRFRQAVLPTCVGLSSNEEMRRLAQESLLSYERLCRQMPGYESDRDRAADVLSRL
ncbi:MAG: hypothetical protein ACRDQ5_16575 [Sciscionella sp.]